VSLGLKTIEPGVRRRAAIARLRAVIVTPAAAAVLTGALLLVAFVARVLLALHVAAPWSMPDELVYALTSRSFLSSGTYLFHEQSIPLRTIYPALVSPAWLAGSTHTAYGLIKAINVGLMTLGAIPLYLWARRLVAPLWAVLVVVLYLAMPGFIYSAEILTEGAFLPSTMLALLALALALERPTLRRQVFALGAIALVIASRLQGVVFLAVVPTAIALVLLLDAIAAAPGTRRTTVLDKLRRFAPSLGAIVVAVAGYAVYELARGHSLSQGLGSYQQLSSEPYALGPVLHWSGYHLGELALSVGIVPVTALIVLFGRACRRSTAPGAPERALLALTTAAVVWIVVEAAGLASTYSFRIEERYMFDLDAPLFLALIVWLARGLPRSPRLLAAAVAAPAALVIAFPYRHFFTGALSNDTFGLIPLWTLTAHDGVSTGTLTILVAGAALVSGFLFAVVPRRQARVVIPVALVGFLVVSSVSVFGRVQYLANATRHAGNLEGDPSWIDRTVGRNARVEVIDTTAITDPHVVWQAEFWNRSIRRVFGVTEQDPSIRDISASVDRSGRVIPALPASSPDLNPHLVVAGDGVDVAGSRIAAAGELVLWRTAGALRLRSVVEGMTPDGWTGATARYTRYAAAPGTGHVVVDLGKPGLGLPKIAPAHVTITVRPAGSTAVWERLDVTVPDGETRRLRLPVRHVPFQVLLNVIPTFSPSQFGSPDTRMLGVRASFAVTR
jgi:hypothetical protein